MPAGFPVKQDYSTGDVLTAANMNDLASTLNYLDPTAKGDLFPASSGTALTRLAVGANGETLVADSSTSTGLTWSYGGKKTAYTPTWGSTGTAPSLGNGTLTGIYSRVGDLVYFRTFLEFGSTTTAGTGVYTFTLPFASSSADNGIAGSGSVLDSGISWYVGFTPDMVTNGFTDKFVMLSTANVPIQNSSPIIFGTADRIIAWGVYSV
jgi:hypothetical protein